jgi:integrase
VRAEELGGAPAASAPLPIRKLALESSSRRTSRHDPTTGERGGPLSHQWFYTERFKPVVEDLSDRGELPIAGTSTLRSHDLRHTCVALLIAKGAQQYEVMEHLGHTNIQTTINMYGHRFPAVRERVRAALEDTWQEGRSVAG